MRRQLEPELDLVAVRIFKEHEWLAGTELSLA
jgi:hypothetical protein